MCLLLLFFLFFSSLCADELTVDPPLLWESACLPCAPCIDVSICPYPAESVIVDLLDPIYEDGILRTENGGVLTAPDLRIQAQKITYIKQLDQTPGIFSVSCEGNILIDYKEWALVGDSFYYDFNTRTGFLINGRTAEPPWYVGGSEILFMEDGSLIVLDGYITAYEGEPADLLLYSSRFCLSADRVVTATNVSIKVHQVPIFWLPKLQLDLERVDRSPFAFKFGWGGFKGSYVSLLYRFPSWRALKATARFDAFFSKGIGLGLETVYNPSNRPTQFYTRNYFAHDIPLDDPTSRDRYRFQGTYFDTLFGVSVNGIYDFVSDAEMASNYTTKDFDLPTAGKTQIELRRKERDWIATLFTKVRVNRFQSVNQELPSFELNYHPFEIPCTGIMYENTLQASYLDYVFSEDVKKATDFSAARLAVHPFIYRPFFFGPVTATPEAGFIGIAYSNSPQSGGAKGQALAEFGVKLESALSRHVGAWKHVIEPYLHYTYLTHPAVNPENHYIFTINDGWERLNRMRFGVRNSFFYKSPCAVLRPIWIDLWANAFFATETIPQLIPRVYLNLEWMPYQFLYAAIDSGWHLQEKQLDFLNTRIDWTLSENLAIGIEYRHRSRFDWRKADFYNFILESTRSQGALLDSPLSDKRNTLLLRLFTRLSSLWSVKLDLRHGWNRVFRGKPQKSYFEYQVELRRIIFQHFRLNFIYERRESDNRYSFSLIMLPPPPK